MINRVFVDGFLYDDAASAYTPAGAERLQFVFAVGAEQVGWKCEVVDAALIERLRGRLSRGARGVLEAQLVAKPFEKHGVQKGWEKWLRVTAFSLVARAAADKADKVGGAA